MSDDVRLQCIQALLDAGASPNANKDDRAPLTYATAQGFAAIVRVLLAAGADPRFADSTSGWTALHAAASQGHVSCAIALIKAGADVEAIRRGHYRESIDDTPLLYAIRHHRSDMMIPILLRAGARLDMSAIAAMSQNLGVTVRAAPYITKIHAAGGWKKYEQAHRKRLTTTFAKAFPRLPVDAISHMIDFAFHVGFY